MNRIVTGYQLGARSVRQQKAVTKLDFFKTKLVMRLLVLGAFIVVLSLFYIWSRVQIVQMGYEIHEIKKAQQRLVDENKKYKLELSVMKSPDRVQRYAEGDLKMAVPEESGIIEIQ